MSEAENSDWQIGLVVDAFRAYVQAEIRYAETLGAALHDILGSAPGQRKELVMSDIKAGGWADKAQMLLSSPWGQQYRTRWASVVPGAIVTVVIGNPEAGIGQEPEYVYWWQEVQAAVERPDGRKDLTIKSLAGTADGQPVTIKADAVLQLTLHSHIGSEPTEVVVRLLPVQARRQQVE